MVTLNIRLPDDQHNQLQELACCEADLFEIAKGITIDQLIEELSKIALNEFDAYKKFKSFAASGNPEEGLEILAKLNSFFENSN